MIKIIPVLFFLIIFFNVYANEQKPETSLQFFSNKTMVSEKRYVFGPLENTISGASAFIIGNVGYFTTKSTVLKITYTGIQTIGILNVGRGIYQSNSPSLKNNFYNLINETDNNSFDKENMAKGLIKIFAEEERAKRLALFYSSSLLAVQYTLNATLTSPPKRLKNIYIFLASVNSIAALYTGVYKAQHESFYFGDKIDLNPIADWTSNEELYGMQICFRF